jgi:hypothetical protein
MTFTNGFALVIGIGTYSNTPKLNVPITAQDAKEIADVLKDRSKCGYPAQQVTLLNDADATRDRILQEFDAIAQKVSDSDTFFLFYSGHGEYGTDGYYLTTHDTQLENKKVVIIDDVLFTGRTIRSGIDALMAYGRPQQVELLALIDRRFKRQLPIQADYVGKTVDSLLSERVNVEWKEIEGEDKVVLYTPESNG